MPRLSLWRENHGNDYKFFDRRMSEMFTIGGTDLNVHKYLGPIDQGTSTDATQPTYLNQSEKNIQDLLFLENRDRKYDSDVYQMRGIYRVNDNDFDLSQFGLFLTSDTLFIVLHLNDMVETLGRKIIVGDVIELPHLKDFYPLDPADAVPAALKRYYVVQDATRAAEGFAPTWYGHLWRIKVQPLVDSQEYKDILNNITASENTDSTLGDLLSTFDNYQNVTEKIIQQAEADVPESGYDTTSIWVEPVTEDGRPGHVSTVDASDSDGSPDASDSDGSPDASDASTTPSLKVSGYLTGDALPPNGYAVQTGLSFPGSSQPGSYFLRLDYLPNRLFRFDGKRWTKVEDDVRTSLTPGSTNETQRSSFVNNAEKYMSGRIGYDAIRAAEPYVVPGNTITTSFSITSKLIETSVTYTSTNGVRTTLNGFKINNTMSNSSGNTAITITSNVAIVNNDLVEYAIFENTDPERVSLSQALKPTAD
jgi:hypothetical protein